jgi:hypothetical protein
MTEVGIETLCFDNRGFASAYYVCGVRFGDSGTGERTARGRRGGVMTRRMGPWRLQTC